MAEDQKKVSTVSAEVKGKKLILTLGMIDPPRLSKQGKTLLVATTGGNKETALKVKGKNLIIGVNAYIYPD